MFFSSPGIRKADPGCTIERTALNEGTPMDTWSGLHIDLAFWMFFPLLFLAFFGYTLLRLWWLGRRAKKALLRKDAH
jgi:hypothetical protein